MTETCPRRGLSEVKECRTGMGVFGGSLSDAMCSRMEGSKTSPRMNGTGNVSEVELKSSCPKSQNSMAQVNYRAAL